MVKEPLIEKKRKKKKQFYITKYLALVESKLFPPSISFLGIVAEIKKPYILGTQFMLNIYLPNKQVNNKKEVNE